MQILQTELDTTHPAAGISIVGLNEVGFEGCVGDEDAFSECPSNMQMCEGRDLPWLQDMPEDDVWGLWEVAYRDVVILDGENRVFAVFNVTQYNLSIAENYAALRSLLLAAAGISG